MEIVVDALRNLLNGAKLKLMDFHPHPRQAPLMDTPTTIYTTEAFGRAILQVSLTGYPILRKLLEEPSAKEKYRLSGLTSSGKIRLVRQRMSLTKPEKN